MSGMAKLTVILVDKFLEVRRIKKRDVGKLARYPMARPENHLDDTLNQLRVNTRILLHLLDRNWIDKMDESFEIKTIPEGRHHVLLCSQAYSGFIVIDC
jgi:hypothetical protein